MKKLFTQSFKQKLSFILFFFLCCGGQASWGQYTVDFEAETKGAYASGAVTLNGISWNMTDALIGNATNDRKNGTKSARIQNSGTMTMLANKANGAGTITLVHAVYGTDANSSWKLEVSNDNGGSWTAYASGTITTSSTTLTSQSFVANVSGNVRVRITKLSGGGARLNIDDISIADYSGVASTSTLAISPTLSEPPTISSLNTAFTGATAPQINAVSNFDFNVVNSDAIPIQFSALVFNVGTGNSVTSWTNALQEAQFSDGTNTVTSTTITATNITFASLPNAVGNIGHVPNGSTKTYTLTVRFKTAMGGTAPTIIDGQDFVFLVNNTSFTFVAGGLATAQAVNSGDGNNTVAVVASRLAFITQPSTTNQNATMTSPTVQAIDANGNRDLGYVTAINITSTGTLDTSPQTATPASGLASTWTIVHTTAGTALELTTSSGSLTSGVSNTFNINAISSVVLSSDNPSVAASNILQGTTNNVIYKFELAVTAANATLTNINFTTAGTYLASDLTNIKLWYSPDATFIGSGNDVQVASKTSSLGVGSQSFTAFSRSITVGTTGYFFLTTDLPCTAVDTKTISINALTAANITIMLGNKSGTAFAGNAQTITSAIPNNVTAQTTSACVNGESTVSWTAPTGCDDNVLVFVKAGGFTAALPTGNGGSYTANTTFGSGTGFDGGFCVFKGISTTVNVAGLTNGTNYTYKIFTRNGMNWSSGVTTNCTPVGIYCTPNPSSVDGIGITNISMGTINNTTVAEAGNYGDYSAQSTNVEQGTTLACDITYQTGFTYNTKIWVDWNSDFDFDDAGEEVYTGVSTASNPTTLNASFVVGGATPVGSYRLRIGGADTNTPTTCYTGSFASYEDYTINVTAPCAPTHTITSFLPTSAPIAAMIRIVGTGFSASSTVTFGNISATSVTFISSTQIIAEVPAGFSTENIKVAVAGCDVTSGATFTRTEKAGTCFVSMSGLIISELYDAQAGSLGYIEIYNGTNATIDLTTYSIRRFNDNTGSVTHTYTFPAAGIGSSIASGQVLVGKVSTDANIGGFTPDFTFTGSPLGYNELDRLELWNGGTQVDEVIAQGVSVGYSYYRKTTITGPNTTFTASEWTTDDPEDIADLGVFASNATIDITANPADVTGCAFTMSVTASGTGLTYQWYFNDRTAMTGWQTVTTANLTAAHAGNSAVTVANATTNALTLTGNLTNLYDYQFYCQVIKGACNRLSNAAQFTYNSRPIYRSIASANGNWTTVANWEMANTTAGPWVSTCTYPIAANSSEVIIQSGTTIVQDIDLSIDKVTIENGGTLEISTSAQLTCLNNSTAADFIINGTFIYRSNNLNSITFDGGATWQMASNATLIKTNTGSTLNLKDNYETGISNIPATAFWIYRYNGDGNVAVVAVDMYYPNLTIESISGAWDGSSPISKFDGSTSGFATVKGNMDVGGTGSGTVTVYNENSNAQPMLLQGNLTVRAGNTLTTNNVGSGFELSIGNLIVNGTLNATGGTGLGLMRFSSTTAEQTISGTTGAVNIANLQVNKSVTHDLKLLRSINVTGTAVLNTGDTNLNGFNMDLGTTATLTENVASNYIVKDLTATTEASQGGYVRFTNRTVNAAQTNIGGSRLLLNRTAGADYTVNIDRYHYVADYGKAAIRLIYKVAVNTGTLSASNPTNLRIDYADSEMMPAVEPFDVARWSSSTGWQNLMATSSSPALNFSQINGRTAFSHWTLRDTNVLLASPTNPALPTKNEVNAGILFYPNPYSGGQARLILPENEKLQNLKIYDMQGRLLATLDLPTLTAKLEALPKGMYILQVQTDKILHNLKFVKQ